VADAVSDADALIDTVATSLTVALTVKEADPDSVVPASSVTELATVIEADPASATVASSVTAPDTVIPAVPAIVTAPETVAGPPLVGLNDATYIPPGPLPVLHVIVWTPAVFVVPVLSPELSPEAVRRTASGAEYELTPVLSVQKATIRSLATVVVIVLVAVVPA
jgi:hypothetical protein